MTTSPVLSITDELLAELQQKAKAASWSSKWYDLEMTACFVDCDEDGELIAAASPATILAMVEHIRSLTERMEKAQDDALDAALAQQPAPVVAPDDAGYPPCDYCGAAMDQMPWHGTGMLRGTESRHIHACDACRHLLPAAEQPDTIPVSRDLLERIDRAAVHFGLEVNIDSDLFRELIDQLSGGDKP